MYTDGMSLAGMAASLSGMQTAILRQAISASNVANVSTGGFKSARPVQTSLATSGTGLSGVRGDFSQGSLETARNAFDLAVMGEGFLPVETPAGIRYSRAGVFGIDGEGNLVTPEGHRPFPAVRIPAGSSGFEVLADGTVRATLPDGTTRDVGRLQVARFANPDGLLREGGGLYAPGPNAGEPQIGAPGTGGRGALASGMLEGSNVDLAREMVELLLTTRTFQFNAAALRAQDETLGTILDIRR